MTYIKRKLIIFLIVTAVFLSGIYLYGRESVIIGSVSGAEWEYLRIGDAKYVSDENSPFSRSDKGRYMGKAMNGDTAFRVYSVKGTSEYIYVTWEWEGNIYRLNNR